MLVVSLLAFFISHGSPIDPIGDQECGNPFNVENFAIYQACREQKIRDYHLGQTCFLLSAHLLGPTRATFTLG
jgi:hypothetical protein